MHSSRLPISLSKFVGSTNFHSHYLHLSKNLVGRFPYPSELARLFPPRRQSRVAAVPIHQRHPSSDSAHALLRRIWRAASPVVFMKKKVAPVVFLQAGSLPPRPCSLRSERQPLRR